MILCKVMKKDKLNERKFQILEMLETPIEENQKKKN